MNSLTKLDQLNLEPAAKTEVAALIQALIEQHERDAKLIQAKDVKIAALTHELAYYKRIRFSTKSEALAPLQRDVFEETWNTDISAIEAEVEQLQDDSPCDTVARPKRPRAGRQALPAHLPRIEPCPELVEGTATSRNLVPAANAATAWSKSAKTLANNWTLSQPSFSFTAIFVHNMPVEPAKASRRHRFRQQ
jgi:hypothetical protein